MHTPLGPYHHPTTARPHPSVCLPCVLLPCLRAVHDVPAGRISIDVSFAGTPIYEEVDDLCSKTSCPIKTGPLDIKYIQDLPPIAPPVSSTQGEALVDISNGTYCRGHAPA